MKKFVIFCAIVTVILAEHDINDAIDRCRSSYPGYVLGDIFDGSYSIAKHIGMQEPLKCFLNCLVRSSGVIDGRTGHIDVNVLRTVLQHREDVNEILDRVKSKCIASNHHHMCENGAKLYHCIDHVVKHLNKSI